MILLGNLLFHSNDNNVFTNEGKFCDTMIVALTDKEWL